MPGVSEFQRVEVDGFTVAFEVDSRQSEGLHDSTPAAVPLDARASLDEELARLDEALREVDGRIDGLANTSDRLDYTIAVVSGVLAGIIDSIWVGELSLSRAREWGAERVNEIVLETARQKTGYTGNDLAVAIRRLEEKFPFAGDQATHRFGGGTIHHLRDWTHHPSPIGLVCSIVMQFTGQAWGFAGGQLSPVDVASSGLIGTTVRQKLLFGTINWVLHLVSDVAGSSYSAGAGTGLPGPLLSLLHEAGSAFAKLRGEVERTEFLRSLEGVFRGDNGGVPFDFRTELGLVNEMGRQALPVLLNEALVRAFFFIRRAAAAIRAAEPTTFRQLLAVDLRPALPWRNRTLTRMLTIASSTFTAVDLLDAGIRAANASGGDGRAFAGKFVLRVNFVGVARTSVAIGVDVHQSAKVSKGRSDRIALVNQQLVLLKARTSYKVGDVWIAAEEATTAVSAAGEALAAAAPAFHTVWAGTRGDSVLMEQEIDRIWELDSSLATRALEDLDWGVES